MKIIYPIIDGEITGGNIIALRIIEEALKRGYGVVVNSPTEGKFTSLLRERGIRVYNIDTRRTFRWDSAIKLAYIIKKEGINIIHSHAPLGGTVLSRLAGWITGVAVINHAHVPYFNFTNRNLITRWYQFLLNWITSRIFCAKVIAVSEFVKKEIVAQGTAAGKITVIYNGIDLGRIKPKNSPDKIREEFGLKQNQRIIGEVARLGEVKGQSVLVEAAQKIIKTHPDIVVMIVGEDLAERGEYAKTLEQLASGLGLKEKIIFTGYREDIMEIMNTIDIFVLPSIIEGLAVVILEAMAAKKPIVATNVGGNPEIVMDGQTGTLIPLREPEKLAEAIIYHLDNPEISKQMGEKGYERVKRYFCESTMINKIMDIYREVL